MNDTLLGVVLGVSGLIALGSLIAVQALAGRTGRDRPRH